MSGAVLRAPSPILRRPGGFAPRGDDGRCSDLAGHVDRGRSHARSGRGGGEKQQSGQSVCPLRADHGHRDGAATHAGEECHLVTCLGGRHHPAPHGVGGAVLDEQKPRE